MKCDKRMLTVNITKNWMIAREMNGTFETTIFRECIVYKGNIDNNKTRNSTSLRSFGSSNNAAKINAAEDNVAVKRSTNNYFWVFPFHE